MPPESGLGQGVPLASSQYDCLEGIVTSILSLLLYHHHVAVLTLNKQEHQKIIDSFFYNISITSHQEQEINPLQKLTKEYL